MATRPLLSALFAFVMILTVAAIVNAANEGYITALNSVPATDKSIQRFPETGSKYDGVLKDYRGIAFHPNMTDMVVVGANGYVFRLDLETFSIQNTTMSENIVQIIPDAKYCGNRKEACPNTMMGVVYNGTSEIFACGTYSYNPRCWMLSVVTLNITRIVSGSTLKDISYWNDFCPKYDDANLTPIRADNGIIFGATDSSFNADKHMIRAIIPPEPRFPKGEEIGFYRSARLLRDPIFKWAYNGDDGFVYFFFHEFAEEIEKNTQRHYDVGPLLELSECFISFSKSQMVCSKKRGSRTDYYDHIQSATAVTMHDSAGKPEVYIYASFTTTLLTTGSSAICRYKFSDMKKVFQTSKYCLGYTGKRDCSRLSYAKNPSLNVAKVKCDATLDTFKFMGQDALWVVFRPLLHDDIESADGTTLVTFRGERITAIAVDDLHNNVNKTDVGKHVIFAATVNGKMFKIMMNSTNKGVPVFLEEVQAVKGSGKITKLTLYKDYIIATGRHVPLMKIAKERCESKFLSCSDCIKSRDPYCAWSLKQNKCARAAYLAPSDRIQDVAVGSDLKCPSVTRPATISTMKDHITESIVTTSPKGNGKTMSGKRYAGTQEKGKETDKYFLPFIVCLVIVILGIFAATFKFYFCRMRSKKVNYDNGEHGSRKSTLDVTAQKAATIFKKRTKSDATKTGKPLAMQDRENSRHFLVDEQADNLGFTTEIDDQAHTKE